MASLAPIAMFALPVVDLDGSTEEHTYQCLLVAQVVDSYDN